ncbi:MAG TPA: helix-hairpin-helix domain-containing protein [Ferruginibacter sp.]|nr:helix-hairpin-helix domain-containing protein [Ferruginibacter sp.]
MIRRMNKYCIIFLFILCQVKVLAQMPELPSTTQQELEALTENNDDNSPQNDYFLQQWHSFLKDPVNLNTADESTLQELRLLTPLQIQNLIMYRKEFGNFINIYELQAIPTWNVHTIQKILPYVTIDIPANYFHSIRQRFNGGVNTILVRGEQVLERSKGYLLTDTTTHQKDYPGSPQQLFVRYKYQYKNLLQFGVDGKKDAGEEFFKGSQKQGFDFYSAHFFVRNIGIIKSLAIGDFVVNLGQGLTQWQGLAFTKSADVLNIKRQAAVLEPYNSSGPFYFNRGAGITFAKGNVEATIFGSYRKLDASVYGAADSSSYYDYIASLETSGYHRTATELANKNTEQQITYGGNLTFNKDCFHVGLNAVQYHFNIPLDKNIDAKEPYNLYKKFGNDFGNYSVDYSYTFKNLHYFGEAAITNDFNTAFINGALISVSNNVDVSLLYRNISEKYQSLYGNAFTENTSPTNEKGLYTGISIRPNNYWQISAYADVYKFPWLKYLVNAPSYGADYFVGITYTPSKQVEWYLNYRNGAKGKNYNADSAMLTPVTLRPIDDIREEVIYKLSPAFTLRNRVELLWFDKKAPDAENGFLAFIDVLYKPPMKNFSGNVRLQYFETDSYNSRLYAYEDDVLYSFSIPVFYGKGIRYYINAHYEFSKKLGLWCRFAQTVYKDQNVIGTGLDEINGNTRTEVKLQAIYQFK